MNILEIAGFVALGVACIAAILWAIGFLQLEFIYEDDDGKKKTVGKIDP